MTTMISDKETTNLTQTTPRVNTVPCTSCQKIKHTLRQRKSKLNPGMQMFLCNTCFEGKFEPRWLIILVGKQNGLGAVKDYLKNKRYFGDEIAAVDLINN